MLLPYLIARLSFDPATFVPIGFVAKQESVFVGSADAPWKDLAAITEAARKAPGDVQYGTAGISTPMHLSTERYAMLNKIKLTHVPFRGTGPLVTDMLGGHVKLGMSSVTRVAQHLSNGKLKAYGMAAPERAQSAPDIPTFKELGFGDVDGTIVYTLIATARHAGTGDRQAQRRAQRLGGDAGDARGPAQARLRRHGRHARGARQVDRRAGADLGAGAAGRRREAGVATTRKPRRRG